MSSKIDISHKTIIFITLFILGIWLIYLIKDLLIILFIGLILMSAITPMVNLFMKLKLTKSLSITLCYCIIIAVISGLFAIVLPPLFEESSKLVSTLPPLLDQLFNTLAIDKSVFQSQLSSLSRNAFTFTLAVFDNLLTVVFLLVLTFYLLLERESLERRLAHLFLGREEKVRKLTVQIEDKLGSWLRGQLLLSFIIGLLSFIGLSILGLPYALPLAVIAGVLEVIPVIGPIISAIPPILIALTVSPILSLGVAAMYFVIQQLENHLLVPQVMKRAVGLNPLVVILAIAIGSRLLGFTGALLAVPIAVVIQIIVTEIIEEQKA